jgi:hypothetical protein
VSEKFQAMVMLGIANSRMKDFYDIWEMARQLEFDGLILSRSLAATFERRQTALPAEVPLALTESFSKDRTKVTQWDAFIRKSRISSGTLFFQDVTVFLRNFLMPPVQSIREGQEFHMIWRPYGPWQPSVVP